MIHSKLYRVVAVVLIASVPILFPAVAMNQSAPAKPQSPSPADDVIRVNTELAQTDVTVIDKKGRLVDQLTANDFELIVEGQPQEIAFFERVVSSRTNNELTASDSAARETSSAVAAARVRTVLFFVDDLHLSAASLEQTRKALLDFVTNRMEENDPGRHHVYERPNRISATVHRRPDSLAKRRSPPELPPEFKV